MSDQPAKVEAYLHRIGGAAGAPPVLFIHGFGADTLSWSFIAQSLVATHQVWAVDLPGHGSAPSEVGTGSVATLATAVQDKIKDEISGSPILIGHSLGGAVALDLRSRLGERPAKSIILAPAGLGSPPNMTFINQFPELQTVEEIEQQLRHMVEKKRLIARPMAQYVQASLQTKGRRSALRKIAGQLSNYVHPNLDQLAGVSCVWGTRDQIIPFDEPRISSLVETLHTLNDVGHLPQSEAVQKVRDIIFSELSADY
jgi:pyruvate dehydrogenase E2 component (dihydrolipoamide acetyltransferase)